MAAPLPHAASAIHSTVEVPGSKSETNRALVLAALADGTSRVRGALTSRDSTLMIDALRGLGVRIETGGTGELALTPPRRFTAPADGIDCGLAGTVMRFVPPLAYLADGPTHFYGDPHASQRPMTGIIEGLRQLGAQIDADQLPFTLVPGTTGTATVVIDASASSQFISGLLLVGARLPHGLHLAHEGPSVPSLPHIDMTVAMLRARGIEVERGAGTSWRVEPGRVAALDSRIEPDLTNAAVFLAAAMVAGGAVTVPGWPESSLQPGGVFLDVAGEMGAEIQRDEAAVTLSSSGTLRPLDVDLHAASELTPVVAALAALAEGTSVIRGVGHIRGHETDRLHALATELVKLGIPVQETSDGLRISGRPELRPASEPFETYADHRMVHAAALLALRCPGLRVTDLECVSKTMPDFPSRWNSVVSA